jgi:hypothetical protein
MTGMIELLLVDFALVFPKGMVATLSALVRQCNCPSHSVVVQVVVQASRLPFELQAERLRHKLKLNDCRLFRR